jgi:hypothetical protein
MLDWFKNYVYEINFFVAGWCAFAALDSLLKGSYILAAVNAVLVYINIKFAK